MLPPTVLNAYAARYPHLRQLVARAAAADQAERHILAFARSAARLAVPDGLDPADLATLDAAAAATEAPIGADPSGRRTAAPCFRRPAHAGQDKPGRDVTP